MINSTSQLGWYVLNSRTYITCACFHSATNLTLAGLTSLINVYFTYACLHAFGDKENVCLADMVIAYIYHSKYIYTYACFHGATKKNTCWAERFRTFWHARWTVSEEERLTTEEALAKAELIASEWTPYNLATFMGTTRNHHKLQASPCFRL